MSEAQLRKIEAERDRLKAELETLKSAMPTKEACQECVCPMLIDTTPTDTR